MKRVVTLIMGLMLVMAMAGFAKVRQGNSQAAKTEQSASSTRVHQATGTISSVDANKLVLSHKVKGKEEETTFVLNDQTKKEGELKPGEHATVHYKIENKEDVATMVKVSPAKASAKR